MSTLNPITVTRRDVAAIIAGTFPAYRGRKIKVVARATVDFHGLNWDGGSRNQYRSCSLIGTPAGSLDRYNQRAPWDNPAEGKSVEIPRGALVVRHSIFCGRDSGLTIYVHPEDMPKLLPSYATPAPSRELPAPLAA